MERQREIRQALNSFLPTSARPEAASGVRKAADVCAPQPAPGSRFAPSEAQIAVLRDLQASLHQHGIDAEMDEIGHGILEALADRPSLCRGLLAAYFLDV